MDAVETESWLADACRGNPAALEKLYHCYKDPVYNLCFRLVGNNDDAQDAMQAAFVCAFRFLPRFRGESSLKTWLYRIATNEALQLLRKRKRTPVALDDRVGCADRSSEVAERALIEAALQCVKPEHKVILILRFWEALSYEEVADVLRLPLSTVRMRLLRAREEFKKWYDVHS